MQVLTIITLTISLAAIIVSVAALITTLKRR